MAGKKSFRNIFFLIVFLSIFFAGLGLSIYFGLEPRPIPKIKLSGVATPQGFSDAVFQRLSEELKSTNLFFVGVGTNIDQKELAVDLVNQFAKASAPQSVQLFLDPELIGYEEYQTKFSTQTNSLFSKINSISLLHQSSFFSTQLDLHHQKIIILAPNVFVTQILKSGPLSQIKLELSKLKQLPKIFSLSLTFFPMDRSEEEQLSPPCLVDSFDKAGTGAFGCVVLQSSRPLYRKKKPQTTYVGFLNQIGETDYILPFRKNKSSVN